MKSNKTHYKNPANSTVHNIKISMPTQRLHIAKYCSHDCTRLPHAHSFAFSAQLRDGRRNFPQLIIGHPDAVSARFTQRQHDHRLLALAVLGICSEGPDALKMIFVCRCDRFGEPEAKASLALAYPERSQNISPRLLGEAQQHQLFAQRKVRLVVLRAEDTCTLGSVTDRIVRLASRCIAFQTRDVSWNEHHHCANGGRTRQPFGAAHRPNGCGGLPEGASPSPAVSSPLRFPC